MMKPVKALCRWQTQALVGYVLEKQSLKEHHRFLESTMLRPLLLVILILALIGSLPAWPYSAGWGYYPSGGFGLIVLILLILALSGRL